MIALMNGMHQIRINREILKTKSDKVAKENGNMSKKLRSMKKNMKIKERMKNK